MNEPLFVLNLDRTPQRLEEFRAANPGLSFERFAAVDGRTLDRADCLRDGLITDSNTYIPGALGATTSHVTLWRRCAGGDVAFHIVEDDVILRRDFRTAAHAALAGLGDWDIVQWVHNFDWPVMVNLTPGLGSTVLQYAHDETAWDRELFLADTAAPVLARLVSAAGLGCYSISPRGAQRLLALCLPIAKAPAVYAARPDQSWENTGLDVEMSRHYRQLNAYLALTSLALAPNDQSQSTARGHLAAMHDPAIANRAVV